MNVQTERLENHSARLIVDIDPGQLEKAKKRAARQLSKRYKIPGFRKGKAPYRIISNYVGEGAILEEAIDSMTQDVYRAALDESGVSPYGPGAVEDFKLDPPQFIFTVPLAPEVDPGDYRSVRLEYEAPEVTDEDVEERLQQLREAEALVEESAHPAAWGDRITVDIHSIFADGEESPDADLEDDDDDEDTTEESDSDDAEASGDETSAEDVETAASVEEATESEETEDDDIADEESSELEESDDDEDEQEERIWYKGDTFVHQHDATFSLQEDGEPVILPGFAEALVGASVDEEVVFTLDVPDDDEDYEEIAGRKIEFQVTVTKIENVTLPEINDDFAARMTQDEDEPLDLLAYRVQIREELEEQAQDEYDSEYTNRVLDKVVEGSTVAYPDEMIAERIEELIQDFDNELQQQGMNLDYYMTITGETRESLYEKFQPQAEIFVERSLVLGSMIEAEQLQVEAEDVMARIDEIIESSGMGEHIKSFLERPDQMERIANNMVFERIMDRLKLIGQGEAPDLDSVDEITDDVTEMQADSEEVVEEDVEEEAPDETENTIQIADEPVSDDDNLTEAPVEEADNKADTAQS